MLTETTNDKSVKKGETSSPSLVTSELTGQSYIGGKEKSPPLTRGEIIFDVLDWGIIGGLVNGGLSVYATDVAHSGWAQPYVNNFVSAKANDWGIFRRGEKKSHEFIQQAKDTIKEAKQLVIDEGKIDKKDFAKLDTEHFYTKHVGEVRDFAKRFGKDKNFAQMLEKSQEVGVSRDRAGRATLLTLLLTGGFLMTYPMKELEDHKVQITEWFDKKIGPENPSEKQHDEIEARHKYLRETEVPQGWGSVLGSRLLMIGTYFGVASGIHGRKNILKSAGLKNFEGMEYYSEKAAEKTTQFLRTSPMAKNSTENFEHKLTKISDGLKEKHGDAFHHVEGAKRLDDIVLFTALETAYEWLTTLVAYGYSRVLAPVFTDKSRVEAGHADEHHTTISEQEESLKEEVSSTVQAQESKDISHLPQHQLTADEKSVAGTINKPQEVTATI